MVVLLSGTAGLGYQMVWSRMFTVSLGHEIVAVIAVIAAFFVGLAIGASLLNDFVRRTRRPFVFYASLEFIIGSWALLLIYLIPYYNNWFLTLIGIQPAAITHWALAFGCTLVMLLPATAAMGATLPVMERIFGGLQFRSQQVARLYALNTFGAVAGTLMATFVLMPIWGLSATMLVFGLVNLLCAITVVLVWKVAGEKDYPPRDTALDQRAENCRSDRARNRLLLVLFATGFLGLGYEVLVVRVLSQILEDTVYTFAAVLSVYLTGTALGAAWYNQAASRHQVDESAWSDKLATLLTATAWMCVLGTFALWFSDAVYRNVIGILGPGIRGALSGEFSVAALVFLLPTVCMGALFSHLAQRAANTTGLGLALGVNTLGAALAPWCFGVLLLPAAGAKIALALIAIGYLLLLPMRSRKAMLTALLPAFPAAALIAAPLPLRFASTGDAKLLDYKEGVMATVAVVADGNGHRHLKVNNHFTMGGTATRFSDHRQTHIPMLLHGAPRTALYLGLGTGITFDAAKFYADLQVTGVELVPEMLPLMKYFGVSLDKTMWPKQPRLLAADARRFVLASQDQYDVIVAEVFHPSRDGAGSLYSVEHFEAVKKRLAPDGLFCQWLPLFQLDLPNLKTIIRTFLKVFPSAQLHLGHFSLQQPILCLIGTKTRPQYRNNWLLERVHERGLQQQLVKLRLNSDFALFGGFLGEGQALAQYSGAGPINTDDRPIITFDTPNFVYSEPEPPAHRLIQLINAMESERGTLLSATTHEEQMFLARLESYWRARDIFLRAGVDVKPPKDISQLLQTIKSPLLEAARLSSDFSPAYEPLLRMARGLFETDRGAAYELLSDLNATNPDNPAAIQLRRQLYGEP